MDANKLFEMALGLGNGWQVINSEMDVAGWQLQLWLDFAAGSQFSCSHCGEWCGVHDTAEKSWQHWTELHARCPRVKCEEHRVPQVEVPWARAVSGFTLMMEGMILFLAQQTSMSAAARLLRKTNHWLWQVIDHHVMAAHWDKDCSKVRRILVHESRQRRDSLLR